jgi:hypothetical protein
MVNQGQILEDILVAEVEEVFMILLLKHQQLLIMVD